MASHTAGKKSKSNRLSPQQPGSFRVGRVLAHQRGQVWYLRYSEDGQRQQPRVGHDRELARRMAAEINAQLESGAPSLLGFEPVTIAELRERWLDHHEHIRRSSVNTIKRYRSASLHLVNFVAGVCRARLASDFRARQAEEFVKYLRSLQVTPNGHKHAKKRPLRDAGIKFILETCCSLFNYAARQRHLSPYAENPFRMIEVSRIPVEDAKPVMILSEDQERRFLEACDDWQFPMFVTLMLTGLRPGELIHLLLPDDLDLENGWLRVRNKPRLGWQVKTRNAPDRGNRGDAVPPNLNPHVLHLLSWHGHSGGGVHVPFQARSNPLGAVIQTPLILRLRALATAIADDPASQPRWVFLVGGPGNGKSETVEDFLRHLDSALNLNGALRDVLQQEFSRQGLLPRKVEVLASALSAPGAFATNVGRLMVVQDATATEAALGDAARELANDIADLLTLPADTPLPVFIACVNRGVLARAMNHAFNEFGAAVTAVIANVIQASSLGRDTLAGRKSCWPLEADNRFCCWPLDVDSLLVNAGQDAPLEQILNAGIVADHWEVDGRCQDCQSRDICPFRKNAEWLREAAARANLVTFLRRGELARGQRWTFRDAFSLVAELLVGQWSDFDQATHPCAWVHGTRANARRPLLDADAALALALRLYPHAVFGSRQLSVIARTFLETHAATLEQPATHALLTAIAEKQQEHSVKPIREILSRDYARLDPATITRKDPQHVIRLIEDAFCQSVDQGQARAGQHALAEAEKLLLDHFSRAEHEWDMLGKGSSTAVAAVCLLRKLSGMIAKRSVAMRQGFHALDEWLADYEASLRDLQRLGTVRDALRPLLGQQGFAFNLVEILGQPTADSAAMITLDGPQPGIRPQPAPNSTEHSPGHNLPCIEIRDLSYRIPVTFDFYMALRLRREGCAGSSLPASVRAALDRVRHRYAGWLCRREDAFIEGRASLSIAGASISIASAGAEPNLTQT